MFSLLTQMTFLPRWNRWFGSAQRAAQAAVREPGVANALMESSQVRGRSRYQAEELRLAARAYLSVVR